MMHGTLQHLLKADTVPAILTALSGENRLAHTFEDNDRILVDEQLVRLLGQDGLICFPMTVRKNTAGVAVLGGSRMEKDRLSAQAETLSLFFSQAALCLEVEAEKGKRARCMKSARLDAAAATARSVIHEVNNPLGIIKNYVRILGLKLPEKHPAQDELNIIGEEIDRVKLLMMNLQAFSVPLKGSREAIDINRMLGGFLTLIDKSLARPSGIELAFHPGDRLPAIQSVKNNIKQAILNVVKNGIESLEKGRGSTSLPNLWMQGENCVQRRCRRVRTA